MNSINLNDIINLTKMIFDIIIKEYSIFLSPEKKELLDNFDYNNFYKIVSEDKLPPIYLNETHYLLNEKIALNSEEINNFYLKLVPLMCFMFVCGDINYLKLCLIRLEIQKLADEYHLNIDNYNFEDIEVAKLVEEKILDDLPKKIIFLDSDVEIFNYLAEEKGLPTAKVYYQISKMMDSKFKDFSNNNFNLNEFFEYLRTINYEDVFDLIYEFINKKIK